MIFVEMLSCAITGHQPQRFKFKYNEQAPLCCAIKAALAELIKVLYDKGVRLFYVGGAVGVDTWAAEIIIDLKRDEQFSDMKLFCAIPFPEQSNKFKDRPKKRYEKILNQCDYKKIVSRQYSPVVYKRRNYFMVDNSQYLIAVYDQDRSIRSGTGQTVNYAIKKGLDIVFIHPDTAGISIFDE